MIHQLPGLAAYSCTRRPIRATSVHCLKPPMSVFLWQVATASGNQGTSHVPMEAYCGQSWLGVRSILIYMAGILCYAFHFPYCALFQLR